MSPVLQIALALGSVVGLMGLMAGVRHLAGTWQIGSEVQRKLVHIGTGIYALTLPWLFPDRWPVYLLVGLTLVVMLLLRLPNSRLGATLHSVERQSYGDFLLAISVGVCLFLAGDQLYLYVLPIAVLTLADAAAALAGSTYGTKFFRVEEGEKSLEGSAVFFTVTLLISVICLMLMTSFAPPNIIVLSLMVAGFGTLVEAASWRGFDNLFLPVGLLIFLTAHGTSTLGELVFLAAIFALSIVAFKIVAPKFGLNAHAVRVYVTSIFLLLAVTDPQNTIFPILVLVAHIWSRSVAPCDSKFPDLDVVAALVLVSLGFLTLGKATGPTAISFYGIAAMGMLMGFCAIAASASRPVVRYPMVLGLALALLAIREGVVRLNPDSANWNGPMWPAVFICVALTALGPMILSRVFATHRVVKLTFLALLIPLPYYVISTGF
ncbi:diacylglycerol/polyprenol kinase family protein [Falsihalocynthiibacter sp. S25ZX9]|uniref:diacylglycerol/polyprenol kinase family protein n=1 Tax=Falsihalocynthiibacter sp. S25ZX9 TaxID=3240870 RepID=UPI00350EAADD